MATINHITSFNEKKDIVFDLVDDRGESHHIALNQKSIQELCAYLFNRVDA